MRKLFFISFFIFFLLFVKSAVIVNAQTPLSNTIRSEKAASISAAKQARKDALSDFKVKACEARQANIQKRSEQIVKRATSQLDTFSKIAQRVEQYYTEKLVPAGKTVANYNTLVADIATKEAAIAPLIAKAQAGAAGFSCDKDRPADQVKQFGADMKAVIVGLEAYRMSVRNLIVAVKGVVGAENSATGSARPATSL